MTNNNIADLQNMDLGKMLIDEDLSKYTTYKVGGKAKVLVFPENKEKLLELLKYIKENNIKYFVMGNGSNLLISSKVFDGVVIKLNKLNNVQIYDNEVYVEAGYPLIKLCMLCADNNLGNLEFASGIPACIGGAICSNAGAYKMEMSDIVESVTAIDKDLNIVTLLKDDLKFTYRDSIFKEDKSYIIISANYFSNSYQHFQQSFQHSFFPVISTKIRIFINSFRHRKCDFITKEKQLFVYITVYLPKRRAEQAGFVI